MNTPKKNRIGDHLLSCIIILLAVILGSCGAIPFRGQVGTTGEGASLAFASSAHAAPKPSSGGDITGVLAGLGLIGGGTQGDVTLSVDTNVIQQRVNGNCAVGSAIRAINGDGSVQCESDDTAGGGVGVQAYFVSGHGLNPTGAANNSIGPLLPITVASGQKVFVTASKALGSTAVEGGRELNLYICYRATSGPDTTMHTVGQGMLGLRVPPNTRVPFSQSALIEGLSGDYEVGMCGHSQHFSGWNDNSHGSVTAIVSN